MNRSRPSGRALVGFSALAAAAGTLALLLPKRAQVEPTPALIPGTTSANPGPVSAEKNDTESGRGDGTRPLRPADPESNDEQTALARMLASETEDRGARVVIGWITIQKARASRRTLYQLLTKGRGYGEQLRDKESFYAATSKPPTAATRQLAAELLSGRLQPSLAIRAVKPGAWVERGQGGKQQVSDERIVRLQQRWKEGIWARLVSEGRVTKWILFSAEKPIGVLGEGQTATAFLDSLSPVEALDGSSYPTRSGSLVA